MTYTLNRGWTRANGTIKWEYGGKLKRSLEDEKTFWKNRNALNLSRSFVGVRIKEKETGKIIYERMF